MLAAMCELRDRARPCHARDVGGYQQEAMTSSEAAGLLGRHPPGRNFLLLSTREQVC